MNSDLFQALIENNCLTQAIDNLILDLNTLPTYYDPFNIKAFENRNELISSIRKKITNNYEQQKGHLFYIPYDVIANRTTIALSNEDLAIRYAFKEVLSKNIKVNNNSDKYNEESLLNTFNEKINAGNKIIIKVDIANFYDTISHDALSEIIQDELEISSENDFIKLFRKVLEVPFIEPLTNKTIIKKKGLLVGNRADEFFAEIFLNNIENKLNKIFTNYLRIADEFILFGTSINELRFAFSTLEELLLTLDLKINYSKNKLISKDFIVTNSQHELVYNQSLLNCSAFAMAGIFFGKQYSILGKKSNQSADKEVLEIEGGENKIQNKNADENEFNVKIKIKETKIENYEDSIQFIKVLMYDKDKLMEYRNKHPNFKHLYNIVFSKPTDFVTDFTKLNLNFLRVSVLEKLVEIIYYYPRSEYYSSEAIKILVFVAKELAHATNIEDSQHVAFELTQACEYANFALVEMLEGNRVHDYQKYLIIRHLFKDSTSLNITLKSFSIKQVVYYTNNSQNDNPSLPFLSKYYEIIESLVSKSESYPLSKICKYIIQQTE